MSTETPQKNRLTKLIALGGVALLVVLLVPAPEDEPDASAPPAAAPVANGTGTPVALQGAKAIETRRIVWPELQLPSDERSNPFVVSGGTPHAQASGSGVTPSLPGVAGNVAAHGGRVVDAQPMVETVRVPVDGVLRTRDGGTVALIDGQTVRVGDRLRGGGTVVAIEKSEAVVQRMRTMTRQSAGQLPQSAMTQPSSGID